MPPLHGGLISTRVGLRSLGFHYNSFQSDTKCDVHIRKEVREKAMLAKTGSTYYRNSSVSKGATLHFPALGAVLNVFAPKQADDYFVVMDERSFKGGHYRF